MPEYNLGTAHGQVVIEYDDRGTRRAAADIDNIDAKTRKAQGTFREWASGISRDAGVISNRIGSVRNSFLSLIGVNNTLNTVARSVSDVASNTDKLRRSTRDIDILGASIQGLASGVGVLRALSKALAAIAVVVGIGIIQQISGAIGLIPAAGYAALVSIAALTIGLKGFGAALSAGMSGDLAKFEEALAKLSPSAADAARAIVGFKTQWEALQRTVQENLFANLGNRIREIGSTYLPILEVGLGRVASALNRVIHGIADFLQMQQTVDDFGQSFDLVGNIIDGIAAGIRPMLSGLRNFGMVGLEVLSQLTGGFRPLMERFEAWTNRVRADGSLKRWMLDGVQAMRDLWAIIKNVWNIFEAFVAGVGITGKNFLGTIREMTASVRAFMESARAQEALRALGQTFATIANTSGKIFRTLLEELGPVLIALLPLIRDLATVVGTILVTALKILGPILEAIAKVLSWMSPVLSPIVGTLLAFGLASVGAAKAGGLLMKAINLMIHGGFLLAKTLGGIWWALSAGGPRVAAALVWFGRLVVGAAMVTAAAIRVAAVWVAQMVRIAIVTAIEMAKVVATIVIQTAVIVGRMIWAATIWAAQWIRMAVVAMANAVRIAAAWLIAMGPIGWIILAIIALVALIIWKWDEIKAVTETVWNAIKNFFAVWWEATKAIFWGAIEAIKALWIVSWNFVRDTVVAIWEGIRNFFVTVWEGIKSIFWGSLEWVKNTIQGWGEWIKNKFNETWEAAKNKLREAWENIRRTVGDAAGAVVNAIANLGRAVWDKLVAIASDCYNAGRKIIQSFIDGIRAMAGAVGSAVMSVVNTARSYLPFSPAKKGPFAGSGWSKYSGQALVQDMADGIRSRAGELRNSIQGVMDQARQWLATNGPNLVERMRTQGIDMVRGLIDGIRGMVGKLVDTVSNVVERAVQSTRGLGIDVPVGTNGAAIAPDIARAIQDIVRGINIPNVQDSTRSTDSTVNVYFDVNNPVPEPASDTAARKMRTLGALGMFK